MVAHQPHAVVADTPGFSTRDPPPRLAGEPAHNATYGTARSHAPAREARTGAPKGRATHLVIGTGPPPAARSHPLTFSQVGCPENPQMRPLDDRVHLSRPLLRVPG